MISFASDYTTGAHPEILKSLTETNFEELSGYGTDFYTERAKEKIRERFQCPEADIYFLAGGTQTNMVAISTLLKDYEGVISAKSGHVNGHESGAIEFVGHKVLALDAEKGKLSAKTVHDYIEAFYQDESYNAMVFPGMVYISFPTEYGTLYTKEELKALYEVCQNNHMLLYIDGARLGYGLMSPENDIAPEDLPNLCDAFYIGGTKVGALCGEALVFPNHGPEHFDSRIKQRGALLAKGRLTGIQFDTLFTDDLYFKISHHAIEMAEKLKTVFTEKGYSFFLDSPANQQFVIMENEKITELRKEIVFEAWEKYDETHTVMRFVTSWSTKVEAIDALAALL